MTYKEITGDLIELARNGAFDVISHGCNCFNNMGAGIAPKMAEAFGCNNFPLELEYLSDFDDDGEEIAIETDNKGDINKLGQIDFKLKTVRFGKTIKQIAVVNSYTQYHYGKNHTDGVSRPLDYEALTLCMRKINHKFKGRHIGLPKIGAGLAGGSWDRIKAIIQQELKDCDVTVVIYDK